MLWTIYIGSDKSSAMPIASSVGIMQLQRLQPSQLLHLCPIVQTIHSRSITERRNRSAHFVLHSRTSSRLEVGIVPRRILIQTTLLLFPIRMCTHPCPSSIPSPSQSHSQQPHPELPAASRVERGRELSAQFEIQTAVSTEHPTCLEHPPRPTWSSRALHVTVSLLRDSQDAGGAEAA